MNKLRLLLSHITYILSAMFIVFLILDKFNPTMEFVCNDISMILLMILCGSTFLLSILNIIKK